ncbi:hypothetical protein AMATHDRAFT_53886 [Amanita thiersii Skay4041]|uniref:Uncharacterized protein n=1 Tax=Amanita thiersii Skay4041 TaxID=703135 RepID=A0A2A9NX68_9AGAR|nr:hypothetical protein AMATHDRAFT_53886 [Amanita thiersii Skay4041]
MPSSKVLPSFRSSRSLHRLRSLHLSPAEANAKLKHVTSQACARDIAPHASPRSKKLLSRNIGLKHIHITPFRGVLSMMLAVLVSFVFISSISLAFVGADIDEQFFKEMLDKLAETSPGIILFGENVDIDIDEPSITIRWSIHACGKNQILPGSSGAHGSEICGLPAIPLSIYIDNDEKPVATYDPGEIPFDRGTSHRRSIQKLVQFDSDHVLDVHNARLYPFDTYMLSSTLHAVTLDNKTLPIQKLATIVDTPSFTIETFDIESYSTLPDHTQKSSRDLDMYIRRPNDARIFTLFLFVINWVLTHITIGHVYLARKLQDVQSLIKHLLSAGVILVALPQIRNSMPDAPGLDGVLIDAIGFFPQMVVSGISVVVLLLILAAREYDIIIAQSSAQKLSRSVVVEKEEDEEGRYSEAKLSPPRPPRCPTTHSTSTEIAQYELHRIVKHLKGEYVFPPIRTSIPLPGRPPSSMVPTHRRILPMTNTQEERMSRWSEDSV